MKIKGFSATAFLIAGIAFFIFGLLTIVRESTILGGLSQILPNAQSIEIFGVTAQFLGQALMVFGVMQSTSHKFLASLQAERQITAAGFTQNIQQLQTKLQADRQALIAGYNQTNAKLDALIANQKTMATPAKIQVPSNCKFCGARIEQGSFCPKCGKAN